MSDRKERWYQKLIRSKNRNVVLICIGIALILWLITKLSEDYIHDYTFHIVYDLPENLSFSAAPQKTFGAQLAGQGWDLLSVSMHRGFSRVQVPVRNQDITRTDLVQALYQHLGDAEIQVREVNVDVIRLSTDLKVQKSVPFVYTGGVRFEEGYQIRDSILVEPAMAIVTGPASICDDIEYVQVPSQDFPTLQSDFRKSVSVASPSPFVELQQTQVDVIVQADQEIRLEFAVPLEIDADSMSLAAQPSAVTIRCTIGSSKQGTTHPGLFRAVVHTDADCIVNGRCPVEIADSPVYARSISMQPSYVRVVPDSTKSADPGI
ncbi:MAG: hypothetical protein R3301_03510 [Saprospiraceae bacterium]|nr:hypothetical protein [Saprospiraceae bacterium]